MDSLDNEVDVNSIVNITNTTNIMASVFNIENNTYTAADLNTIENDFQFIFSLDTRVRYLWKQKKKNYQNHCKTTIMFFII